MSDIEEPVESTYKGSMITYRIGLLGCVNLHVNALTIGVKAGTIARGMATRGCEGTGMAARDNEGAAARDNEGAAARDNEGTTVRKDEGTAAREDEGTAARDEGTAARDDERAAARDDEGAAARDDGEVAARDDEGAAARDDGGVAARDGTRATVVRDWRTSETMGRGCEDTIEGRGELEVAVVVVSSASSCLDNVDSTRLAGRSPLLFASCLRLRMAS